jgi:hypothetical protein
VLNITATTAETTPTHQTKTPPKHHQKPNKPHTHTQVRPFNLRPEHCKPIRDLDPLQLDTLVAVRGMVTRTGGVIPDLRVADFRCDICRGETSARVEEGAVAEPKQCPHCGQKHTLRLLPNRSQYINRQIVKMQARFLWGAFGDCDLMWDACMEVACMLPAACSKLTMQSSQILRVERKPHNACNQTINNQTTGGPVGRPRGRDAALAAHVRV